MKKIILLLLVVNNIFAQECKFERNEIDAFSKQKVVETKPKAIVDVFSPTQSVLLQFLHDKENYITTTFDIVNYQTFIVRSEDNVLFLLNNDEVITFNTDETIGDHNQGVIVTTRYKMKYKISLEEINKIRNIGIKKIRLENSKKTKDFDVSSKNKIEKLNNTVDCFLAEISKI